MWHKYTVQELKIIIRDYNLHTKIKNYSSLKKKDLISKIKEHLEIEEGSYNIRYITGKKDIYRGSEQKLKKRVKNLNKKRKALKQLSDEVNLKAVDYDHLNYLNKTYPSFYNKAKISTDPNVYKRKELKKAYGEWLNINKRINRLDTDSHAIRINFPTYSDTYSFKKNGKRYSTISV